MPASLSNEGKPLNTTPSIAKEPHIPWPQPRTRTLPLADLGISLRPSRLGLGQVGS